VIGKVQLPGDISIVGNDGQYAWRLWNQHGYGEDVMCLGALVGGLMALVVHVRDQEALVVVDGAVGWVSVKALRAPAYGGAP